MKLSKTRLCLTALTCLTVALANGCVSAEERPGSDGAEREAPGTVTSELVTAIGNTPPPGVGFKLHGLWHLKTLDASGYCAFEDKLGLISGIPKGLGTAPCVSTAADQVFALYAMDAGGYNLCRTDSLMQRTREAPNDEYFATCLLRSGTTDYLGWQTRVLSSRPVNTTNAFVSTVGPLRDDGNGVIGYVDSIKKLTREYTAGGYVMLGKATSQPYQKWTLY